MGGGDIGLLAGLLGIPALIDAAGRESAQRKEADNRQWTNQLQRDLNESRGGTDGKHYSSFDRLPTEQEFYSRPENKPRYQV